MGLPKRQDQSTRAGPAERMATEAKKQPWRRRPGFDLHATGGDRQSKAGLAPVLGQGRARAAADLGKEKAMTGSRTLPALIEVWPRRFRS